MKTDLLNWRKDKLKTMLVVFWLITVFSSFFGSVFSLTYLPGIGALYPFRIFLPITVLLYLAWMIREKYNPWKHASYVYRICYVLCLCLVVYGGVSLFWAIDRAFTFRRWFNLCVDLCFFLLALELGKDKTVFLYTLRCIVPAILIHIVIGIVETFFGGVFFPCRDTYHNITFFGKICHWPMSSTENTNDYSMMLVLALAMLLMYWAWRHHEEKCDWIPVSLIAPIYFLIRAGGARLCEVAFLVLLAGFVLYSITLKRKKRWILLSTILLLGFVVFGCNHKSLTEKVIQGVELMAISADAAAIEQAIPLSDKASMIDEFFVVDQETGELRANQNGSAGIRLYLLMHALDCFMQSKGMGVGLGNAEQLAKVSEANSSGIWNIHCFLARMTADFGIFFLVPLLLIVFALLHACFKSMRQAVKERNASNAMLWLLYLTVLISYPFASTAPSEAQDLLVMWLFLAGIVLFPMHMQKNEQE